MSLKNSFNSSLVVLVERLKFRIAIETLGIGTLTALPVSFPASSGTTCTTAFAAPVSVSTIFRTADLPRRLPLW